MVNTIKIVEEKECLIVTSLTCASIFNEANFNVGKKELISEEDATLYCHK